MILAISTPQPHDNAVTRTSFQMGEFLAKHDLTSCIGDRLRVSCLVEAIHFLQSCRIYGVISSPLGPARFSVSGRPAAFFSFGLRRRPDRKHLLFGNRNANGLDRRRVKP